jgi:hypothetical protein
LRYTDFEDIVTRVQAAFGREMGKKQLRPAAIKYARWVREAGGSVAGSYRDLTAAREHLRASDVDGTALLDATDAAAAAVDGSSAVPVLPLDLLKRSNNNHMQPLFTLLRRSASVIHYYLREFVFPQYMRYQGLVVVVFVWKEFL